MFAIYLCNQDISSFLEKKTPSISKFKSNGNFAEWVILPIGGVTSGSVCTQLAKQAFFVGETCSLFLLVKHAVCFC